jgi:hypothetical protein
LGTDEKTVIDERKMEKLPRGELHVGRQWERENSIAKVVVHMAGRMELARWASKRECSTNVTNVLLAKAARERVLWCVAASPGVHGVIPRVLVRADASRVSLPAAGRGTADGRDG